MGEDSFWSDLWNDILAGGNPRWKVDDLKAKEGALSAITSHEVGSEPSSSDRKLSILCPLAGDDLFVPYSWGQGHSVTAIDLVPAAVAAMRKQFPDGKWHREEHPDGMIQWTHSSGRATLFEGNVFTIMSDLNATFDAVYDKDSFGALEPHMRSGYCDRLADYLKPGGIVYTEVKNKSDDLPTRFDGPPYHLEKGDLMKDRNYGRDFEYVKSLGEVYKSPIPGMFQTGHILRRK